MRSDDQAVIMLVLGLFLARVVFSGHYLWYVQPALLVPLVITVAVLVGVAAVSFRQTQRAIATGDGDADPPDAHGEHDAHGPGRAAYLLAMPIVVLIVVAPAPLGAAAANQTTTAPEAEPAGILEFPPLPAPRDGAIDVTVNQAVLRTTSSVDGGLQGEPIRLTGFVVPDDRLEDGYLLTRFAIGCCAADAIARQVGVVGLDEVPAEETWQEVVAVWDGATIDDERIPVFEVVSATTIPEPDAPYE